MDRDEYFLDVFERSLHLPHGDNIHMGQEFYDHLAKFWMDLMLPSTTA